MSAVFNRARPACLRCGMLCTGLLLLASSPGQLFGQSTPATDAPRQPGVLDDSQTTPAGGRAQQSESKRILGIVPNYRTSPSLNPYVPISSKEKFKVASQDAFDRGTVVLAAAFAGEGQLTNSNRDFGQGAAGYGRYFGTAYADYVIGDFMTEGIYPTLFHQDPRYFRKGEGSGWSRLTYAVGQILLTHNDSGKVAFNYSEIIGNSTAVAISIAYYSNNRDASDAVIKLTSQLGVDAASNLLKEFWPDLHRKFSRKH
ncbi:MAG TPA: hypothetical protein VK604_26750 [Bryobacteraceae bacterium]|nr:hypothetical protein [Bryobacteraceae bacterium]